jgi:peptide/nickel transport system substrate-binding protein
MARAATASCCARPWGSLAEAGWTVTDQGLTNAAGEQFAFTITVVNKDQEKIALHYQRTLQAIGIKADVRMVDSAQFARSRNPMIYDMIPATWFNSLSPGNEQMLYFGSEGRRLEGTRNYPGIADPGVDKAIKAMLDATSARGFRRRRARRGQAAGVGLLHGAAS